MVLSVHQEHGYHQGPLLILESCNGSCDSLDYRGMLYSGHVQVYQMQPFACRPAQWGKRFRVLLRWSSKVDQDSEAGGIAACGCMRRSNPDRVESRSTYSAIVFSSEARGGNVSLAICIRSMFRSQYFLALSYIDVMALKPIEMLQSHRIATGHIRNSVRPRLSEQLVGPSERQKS